MLVKLSRIPNLTAGAPMNHISLGSYCISKGYSEHKRVFMESHNSSHIVYSERDTSFALGTYVGRSMECKRKGDLDLRHLSTYSKGSIQIRLCLC